MKVTLEELGNYLNEIINTTKSSGNAIGTSVKNIMGLIKY